MDEYLRENWEQYERDGKLNADARAALELEKNGRRYSINKDFDRAFDKWVADGRPDGRNITAGVTPAKFQRIGLEPKEVSWDSKKLNKMLKDHPYLTDDILKQASYMVDNPVLVMTSNTQPNSIVS